MIESCLRKRTGSSTFCSPFAADDSLLPSDLKSHFRQLEPFCLSKTPNHAPGLKQLQDGVNTQRRDST
ncbi:hypothetical protein NL676_000552 [Syzygium grande]|nr:hypothetical protein NL676_000542 [Syzygium grande]KAI6672646.1 hypothetical protein NL676_000552 [Syzygium grande]